MSTHAEESPEVIILRIHLHHRIDGQASFESGCFHIEMLLLIYSVKYRRCSEILGVPCCEVWSCRGPAWFQSQKSVLRLARLISIPRRELSVLVCKMFIKEHFISDALHYSLEKIPLPQNFLDQIPFAEKIFPCSSSELFIAIQERLKWLTFFSSVSCIFYLLLCFQLPVHYMTETMHQIGHM